MKQLILMRHAKADDHFSGSDLNRPLTQEGIDIQNKVALYLKKKFLNIDAIFYSPFKRAEDSAQIIQKIYPKAQFLKEPALGTIFDSYTILQHINESKAQNALALGHAPTLAVFAQSLLEVPKFIEFDKSGFVVIAFEDQIAFGSGDLVLSLSPQQII